jgi:hypothetical protein
MWKNNKTGLPLKSFKDTLPPNALGRVNCGAFSNFVFDLGDTPQADKKIDKITITNKAFFMSIYFLV